MPGRTKPLPDWARHARGVWTHTGRERPPFAQPTAPGEQSVWDYPRPPHLEPDSRHVIVRCGEVEIANTRRALRLLETASAPTFYIPPVDVDLTRLMAADGSSRCEWKGEANYFDVVAGARRIGRAAWRYAEPFEPYGGLAGHFAFYPSELECFVDGERARPQPGGFYGGWVTSELRGPFKGEPGTHGW